MNKSSFRATKILRRITLGVAVTAAFVAAPAWATPVNTWNFNVMSTFSSATDTNGDPITPTDGNTRLTWGQPLAPNTIPSSLVIDPSNATGSVDTYFGSGAPPLSFIADATVLTHDNFTITGASLKTAVLSNTVSLTPPGLTDQNFAFNITFNETTNAGPCSVGSAPCADIFVLDNSSFNQQFTYDNQDYFLSFFALDNNGMLNPLADAACASAGASSGCYGFITQENASNPLQLGLAITNKPIGVPEPGSVLLMGMGLLGVGFAIRKRKLAVRS